MTCRKDELVAAETKLLERLDENLMLSLKASQRSGVTTVLDDDGVTTVWDEGGTTAFLWHASSPGKGVCLHFLAPLCGLPQGDRTLFYERLMDPSGYEGPFTWQVANGQVSLVGSLPVDGLTEHLTCRTCSISSKHTRQPMHVRMVSDLPVFALMHQSGSARWPRAIVLMPSRVLMHRPPLSNVTPLPTIATRFRGVAAGR